MNPTKRHDRFLALFICVAIAIAPIPGWSSGGIVKEIEFVGAERIPVQTLSQVVKTAKGQSVNSDTIAGDIKALYKLGQFKDIRVESTDVSGGVKLSYMLEEKPIVAAIGFAGNRKIKAKDLSNEVTQRTFEPLNDAAIAESMEKIREAYSKKGYYLADVDYHMETTDNGDPKLVFDVSENKGVVVRKVQFIGNKVFKDDELRKVIRTRKKTAFSFMTGTGKYEDELLKNDMMMLMYHYLNNGYLKVKVSPAKVTISKDKRYIFISFQIYEGNQYKIGKVTMSGDILTTPEELASLLSTKTSNIYSQRTLDTDLNMLTELYGDEGYAYAAINPATVPDDETLTADIDIRISKGKRISIERINIIGNTTTRDKVIRREVDIKENDRYSERALKKSKEKLMRLGYFEDVTFATPRGSRDDRMVVNITVKEKPTGSFNISAGFSTFEQFIFSASVQKENFFGYGVGGQLSAELSKRRQMFTLSLRDPYFLDSEWGAGFSIYRNAFLYPDFRRESLGGDVTLSHKFFDNFEASLGYQIEDVQVSDFSFAVPQLFREGSTGLTSGLNLSVSRDTRDNRIVPSKGMFNGITQEISGTKLGGDNDFYRLNCRTMFYQPVWKGIIFKQFGRFGYIKSLNDRPVPLFERFFMGGPNSLRGFYPNSIGPKMRIPSSASGGITDFVYGGDRLLLFVTELEMPIVNKAGIKAVGFFDAGNTYGESENISINKLRLDYGFGIRWNSPMGPLRFEWGIPINRQPGEDSVQFNFSIGNFF